MEWPYFLIRYFKKIDWIPREKEQSEVTVTNNKNNYLQYDTHKIDNSLIKPTFLIRYFKKIDWIPREKEQSEVTVTNNKKNYLQYDTHKIDNV